jgi:hypothetical protein
MQQRNGGNWSVPCKNFASQAATASAATAHPVESYNLDAEGNRVASHRSAFHLTEPANRLVEDEQHVYEIDADGLQIRKTVKSTGQTWRYAYNPFDQLDFAREYATAASTTVMRTLNYKYDALGRRMAHDAECLTVSGGALTDGETRTVCGSCGVPSSGREDVEAVGEEGDGDVGAFGEVVAAGGVGR